MLDLEQVRARYEAQANSEYWQSDLINAALADIPALLAEVGCLSAAVDAAVIWFGATEDGNVQPLRPTFDVLLGAQWKARAADREVADV